MVLSQGPFRQIVWLGEVPSILKSDLQIGRESPNLGIMAKGLTKSQIAASLAESVGITKKQAEQGLESLAALAFKNANNSVTIPGVGKLVLIDRGVREGRNPASRKTIKPPIGKAVKLRTDQAAKGATLSGKTMVVEPDRFVRVRHFSEIRRKLKLKKASGYNIHKLLAVRGGF